MKRIMLLMAVSLVVGAMMVAMAMPAFAAPGHGIYNHRSSVHTDLNSPDNAYASGESNSYLNGGTYVYTYKGPASPPGSDAAGGNPGYTGETCHGPGC
jgi:hypothetical protein